MTRRYLPSIERNLLACYYRANADDLERGLHWYDTARSIGVRLSDSYGITPIQAIGVIAALSPGNDWQRNVVDAETVISEYLSGLRGRKMSTVGPYGRRNRDKACSILSGKEPLEVLGGPKVRSFYANMLNPDSHENVTVDRHAKCCAFGLKNSDNSIVKNSEYDWLVRHFVCVANKVDLIPCQFQAIVWVTWRRLNGNLRQFDLDFGLEEIPF